MATRTAEAAIEAAPPPSSSAVNGSGKEKIYLTNLKMFFQQSWCSEYCVHHPELFKPFRAGEEGAVPRAGIEPQPSACLNYSIMQFHLLRTWQSGTLASPCSIRARSWTWPGPRTSARRRGPRGGSCRSRRRTRGGRRRGRPKGKNK